MKKSILIIGVILLSVGLVSIFLGNADILPLSNFKSNGASSTKNPQLNSGIYKSEELLIPKTDTKKVASFYSSIIAFVMVSPSTENQEITFQIGIKFTSASYPGCDQNLICTLTEKVVIFPTTDDKQVNLVSTERTLPIPIMTSGLTINAIEDREYYIILESSDSFSYFFQYESKWRITVILGFIILLIGLIITIVGFVKKSSGYKPIPARPLYEPVIGSGSRNSSSISKGSNKSSSKKDTVVKQSRTLNCKKCNGVVPRNSQYCPHCYTKLM